MTYNIQGNPDSKPIADNIKQHARRANVLFIWTDCDREASCIELDLRVGASFTRYLTLSLRPVLQRGSLSEALKSQLISYGSCLKGQNHANKQVETVTVDYSRASEVR
ncbi:hypothetical protein TESG_08618 [Trichophyton tonsurans CBS 112818]|uniref:DNA topoisomerase n=1 Tax=Trichophyton tonsurans (strain CBS 112818) TaxID=647933 RepID=F2S8I1_TRIT1|nr:hypothetical protein TESG_08618 [Trichophyton tonsurans CBS 112818]